MLAVAMGLRSGADGGPISVETADIRHVLLAPMSRRAVLFTPIWQRLRSTMFSFGLVGAVVGQLVATELVGSRAAWAASCGIYGAIVGALFVGAGVLAHAVRLPRWTASADRYRSWSPGRRPWHGGSGTTRTEGLARIAPANLAGNVALWGIDQRPIDWLAIVATIIVDRRVVGLRRPTPARAARPAWRARVAAALRGDVAGPAHGRAAAPPAAGRGAAQPCLVRLTSSDRRAPLIDVRSPATDGAPMPPVGPLGARAMRRRATTAEADRSCGDAACARSVGSRRRASCAS